MFSKILKRSFKLKIGFAAVSFLFLLPLVTLAQGGSGGQGKTDVCHVDDGGNYRLISIADPALDSHIGHGDKVPGIGGLDENCQPRRYIDNGDGSVTDTQTGLIWLKDAGCLGAMSVSNAINAAGNLSHGQCGLTDGSVPGVWRLPTKVEWEATVADAVALGCIAPALTDTAGTGCFLQEPMKIFTNIPGFDVFWSSTFEGNALQFWYMSLGDGTMGILPFSESLNAWPVR